MGAVASCVCVCVSVCVWFNSVANASWAPIVGRPEDALKDLMPNPQMFVTHKPAPPLRAEWAPMLSCTLNGLNNQFDSQKNVPHSIIRVGGGGPGGAKVAWVSPKYAPPSYKRGLLSTQGIPKEPRFLHVRPRPLFPSQKTRPKQHFVSLKSASNSWHHRCHGLDSHAVQSSLVRARRCTPCVAPRTGDL